MNKMGYTIAVEELSQLERYRHDESVKLRWEPLFILPAWLNVWENIFTDGDSARCLIVREDDNIIGIAPLLVSGTDASIVGSVNVCDYFDFPVMPGKETAFYNTLLEYLKTSGLKTLDAQVCRPDATIITHLVPVAGELGHKAILESDEVSPEIVLPASWDAYIQSLEAKQRHELRRKLRRFTAAGEISSKFITSPPEIPSFNDLFLKMFTESREDKADFLTPQMEQYFRSNFQAMAEIGIFRGFILELDRQPVAALVAYDYHDVIYLYNSGFERQYDYLSVGVLSKALLIKDSIERGKKKFDFLKGSEPYKFHLGGKEVRLQKCRIEIA